MTDDQHSRPPGARYDPVRPGDVPPTGHLGGGFHFPGGRGDAGPGGRNGGPGGFGPPNPFGGFGVDSFI